jgi:hypothetical protein
MHGDRRYVHRVLVGRHKEKGPLGRHGYKWEDDDDNGGNSNNNNNIRASRNKMEIGID